MTDGELRRLWEAGVGRSPDDIEHLQSIRALCAAIEHFVNERFKAHDRVHDYETGVRVQLQALNAKVDQLAMRCAQQSGTGVAPTRSTGSIRGAGVMSPEDVERNEDQPERPPLPMVAIRELAAAVSEEMERIMAAHIAQYHRTPARDEAGGMEDAS